MQTQLEKANRMKQAHQNEIDFLREMERADRAEAEGYLAALRFLPDGAPAAMRHDIATHADDAFSRADYAKRAARRAEERLARMQ